MRIFMVILFIRVKDKWKTTSMFINKDLGKLWCSHAIEYEKKMSRCKK